MPRRLGSAACCARMPTMRQWHLVGLRRLLSQTVEAAARTPKLLVQIEIACLGAGALRARSPARAPAVRRPPLRQAAWLGHEASPPLWPSTMNLLTSRRSSTQIYSATSASTSLRAAGCDALRASRRTMYARTARGGVLRSSSTTGRMRLRYSSGRWTWISLGAWWIMRLGLKLVRRLGMGTLVGERAGREKLCCPFHLFEGS